MKKIALAPRNLFTDLILIFPLLIIYQLGVLLTYPMLNGADFVSALLFGQLGFTKTQYLLFVIVVTLLFLGGWLPPFGFLDFIPGWIWLAIKVFVVVTMFLWVRATFPRFRYDQIMRLGWKIFIPITLVWLVVVGLWIQSPFNIWN